MRRMLIIGAMAAALSGCSLGGDDDPAEVGVDAPFSTSGWDTEFSNHNVPLEEFVGGGPPKDGIPSIDAPKFVSIEEADRFLDPREPVAAVQVGGEVRAYPIQILI